MGRSNWAKRPLTGVVALSLNYGAYLTALTHYAVLYQQSPVGLPHALARADGTPADDPGPEVAQLMQETVWGVVTSLPRTGVRPEG